MAATSRQDERGSDKLTTTHVSLQYLSIHDSDKSSGKLGQLSLNLAEYVGKGKTVRRYLLDGSKTNATLKVAPYLRTSGVRTLTSLASTTAKH